MFTAEIWADNWFTMHVNGAETHEDSVPFLTVRSPNAESVTFTGDPPMTLAFEFRDLKENDTGLEYIGTRKQQMGEGGAIAQTMDAAETVVSVTDESWLCLTTHAAPVNASCTDENNPVEGQGSYASQSVDALNNWTSVYFDKSGWTAATTRSVNAVRPKDGHDLINWSPSAEINWSSDLVRDNTVLCRTTIQ
jgi:hypothetical protein